MAKNTDQAAKDIAKGHQKMADEGDSGKTRAEIAAAEAKLTPGHKKGSDD